MAKLIFLILSLISVRVQALDDALFLAQIVSNTAQELAELEKLVTETTKHTQKMVDLSETIDDYSYRVDRLKSWGEDLVDLNSEDPKTLEEINSLLKQIRLIEEDTEALYFEYSKKHLKNNTDKTRFKKISKNQNKNSKKYKKQALRRQKNTSDSMQQVAQNTATIAYEQSKSNQLIAQQNEKLAELYSLMLEQEKREMESKTRIKKIYEDK